MFVSDLQADFFYVPPGKTKETRELKANIAKVGKPDQDPVYGVHGPLSDAWPK